MAVRRRNLREREANEGNAREFFTFIFSKILDICETQKKILYAASVVCLGTSTETVWPAIGGEIVSLKFFIPNLFTKTEMEFLSFVR